MGLKNIPAVITPELLYVLSSMGHGDEIVLSDIHFPTSSLCRNGPKEIRADGVKLPILLEAILTLLPLDTYASSAAVMNLVDVDKTSGDPPIWSTYTMLIKKSEKRDIELERVERFQFYERAKHAYAIVHTGHDNTEAYGGVLAKVTF